MDQSSSRDRQLSSQFTTLELNPTIRGGAVPQSFGFAKSGKIAFDLFLPAGQTGTPIKKELRHEYF